MWPHRGGDLLCCRVAASLGRTSPRQEADLGENVAASGRRPAVLPCRRTARQNVAASGSRPAVLSRSSSGTWPRWERDLLRRGVVRGRGSGRRQKGSGGVL
ncbi:hypothetical protein BDA96_04G156100 [Sorghum bicolor]|uniref:Uncharacterized protein n=1 Tax=Sorghum bicolor TaxID=4558 RepID=A0A921UJ44_SORBI|nr:hypothetical protein BDA96_04G156100 [Sorghum bicolor]